MKRTYIILMLTASLAVFCGCSANLSANNGDILPVDIAGHFTEDISYSAYSIYFIFSAYETFTFYKNGSFEFIEWGLESTNGGGADINNNNISNEGRVQIAGLKGSYYYTTSNYYMSLTSLQDLHNTTNTNTNGMEYYPSQYSNLAGTGVFTSRGMYFSISMIAASILPWILPLKALPLSKVGDDSSKNYALTLMAQGTNGSTYAINYNVKIDPASKTYTRFYKWAVYGGTNYYSQESYDSNTILTNYPSGANFDVGQNVTFSICSALSTTFTNTNANGTGLPVGTNTTPSYGDLVFGNYNRFLLFGGVSSFMTKAMNQ